MQNYANKLKFSTRTSYALDMQTGLQLHFKNCIIGLSFRGDAFILFKEQYVY